MKITKADLLERIEALENENKQRGIGNQFMTLKCIQGNRHFTKDATYCASKLFDRTVITTNFGSRKELRVNTDTFGGYKVTSENQTAVFQVIGADVEPEPQLKQLDQSIFDGLDEKWRFAAVDADGSANGFDVRVHPRGGDKYGLFAYADDYANSDDNSIQLGEGYDASNWQNSLIERDTAKELPEVDLSSELTGSELCRAMLARGDRYVMCGVSDVSDLDAASNEYDDLISDAVTDFDNKDGLFGTASMRWIYAVPINNQGEPLTAAEVGL